MCQPLIAGAGLTTEALRAAAFPVFCEEELDAVAAFLEHVSKINNANWPPNVQG